MPEWTASAIRNSKGKHRISVLTAYDYSTARLIDDAGVNIVLVGDSLAMTVLGYETTLPVTMNDMLHHTAAVSRGVENALVVADMPFLSYQADDSEGIRNAGRFLKESGADAVKIEGGAIRISLVKKLVANGIPVLAHIGLTPQSIRQMGGYKVQGRIPAEAAALLEDAKALADSGAFALILECVPAELAKKITESIDIPTIGIGAGKHCDGQVLVSHDILGLFSDDSPRFVKRYAELGTLARNAFTEFRKEVEEGVFPDDAHSY